jgi:peptidoglycan hydrolase-like amidase
MAKTLLACFALLFASTPACSAQTLRISVLSRFRPRQLDLRPSRTQALVVRISGKRFVLEPDAADAEAQIEVADGQLRIAIHGETLWGARFRAAGRAGAADFILSVPGKVTRRYFGALAIEAKGGKLEAIVTMNLETAVASVVEAETEAGTPIEALKAQAVATRSYFIAAKGRHAGFDFCDLAHCQVLRSPPPPGSPARRATAATRGLVLSYREQPFAAMFTRSCAGRTRTPAEDGLPARGYPYFAVACDYCRKNPFRWTRTVSPKDAALLASEGENGRLELCRRLGWNAIPSDDFSARKDGGKVVLEGSGQGHGIGLCQRGAEAMAASGEDFRAILLHYFPNAAVARIGEFAEH